MPRDPQEPYDTLVAVKPHQTDAINQFYAGNYDAKSFDHAVAVTDDEPEFDHAFDEVTDNYDEGDFAEVIEGGVFVGIPEPLDDADFQSIAYEQRLSKFDDDSYQVRVVGTPTGDLNINHRRQKNPGKIVKDWMESFRDLF